MVIYESGFKQKYFMEDVFEKGVFLEINEDTFDDLVVRFRNQYKMHYDGDDRVFVDINSGLRYIIKRCPFYRTQSKI